MESGWRGRRTAAAATRGRSSLPTGTTRRRSRRCAVRRTGNRAARSSDRDTENSMKRVKLRQGLERSIVRAVVSLSLVAVACVTAIPAPAQTVVASKTRPRVETLASSKFEGREVGSRGEQLAGDYIA